jgi:hypothetical protein
MAAATSGFVIEEKSTGADGGVAGGACANAWLDTEQVSARRRRNVAMTRLVRKKSVTKVLEKGGVLGGLTPCRSPGEMAFCDVDGAGRVVIGSTRRGGRNPAGKQRGRPHLIEFWPNLPQNSQPAQIAETLTLCLVLIPRKRADM